jgi:aldose 1-epimerase
LFLLKDSSLYPMAAERRSPPVRVSCEPFGSTASGEACYLWTLTADGFSVAVTNFGATVISVNLPTASSKDGGSFVNVAPCHATVGALDTADLSANPKLGATCGRVANRTSGAAVELDGHRYALTANDGPHHLHGGVRGFDRRIWTHESTQEGPDFGAVSMRLESADGDEGYPGHLSVRVVFSLFSGQFGIEYEARVADGGPTTVCNLTNVGALR